MSTSLEASDVMAFAPTCDAARAVEFYRDKLGLRLVSLDNFAAAFDANGIMLRVSIVPKLSPQPFTILGWKVADIAASVRSLHAAGVSFERYDPNMGQDELGIWAAPGGAKVAWFKDPDGNILSLTQF
jgi:catechol 2,3-dioxygenase-like lactoylglutathione lyase family enzyme